MGDVDDSATAAIEAIDEVLQSTLDALSLSGALPDIVQYTPPPYFLNWQRVAVKELSQLLVELGSGCHMSIEEFTEAMEQAGSQVREYAYSVGVAMPPPAPSTRSIFEDF
jgi:hypothetical protein